MGTILAAVPAISNDPTPWGASATWLESLPNIGVGTAFVAIAIALSAFIFRRRDIPFSWMYWFFITFFLLCGVTYFLEAAAPQYPAPLLVERIKSIAAVISWLTVIGLIIVLPRAYRLRTRESLAREISVRREAEAELGRRSEQLKLKSQVLLKLTQTDFADFCTTAHDLTQKAARALGVRRVGIWLFSRDRTELVCEAITEDGECASGVGHKIATSDYPNYFQSLTGGRTIDASHALTDPRTMDLAESYLAPLGITSMLDVPIRQRGEVRGVMCYEHIGPSREWSVEDQDFAAGLADFAALAVEAADRREAEAAARRQTALFEAAFDGAGIGMALVGTCGNIRKVNASLCRMLHYPLADLVGRPLMSLLHSEEKADDLVEIRDRLTGDETTYEVEKRYRTRSGLVVYSHVSASFVPAIQGEPAFFIFQFQDITQRKHAEAALDERSRAADARAKVAAAVAESGETSKVLRACCDALVSELNTAFTRVWLLSETEPILELKASAGMYTHLDGKHRRIPVGKFKVGRIAENREPLVTNAVMNDPEISDRDWAEREDMTAFAGYPMMVDGRLIGVLATFSRDPLGQAVCDALAASADLIAQFVERRRFEEGLRLRDRAIAAFFQGVVIADATDPEHPIVYVNQGFEQLTGYTLEESKGRNCRFLQGPQTDRESAAKIHDALQNGRPCIVELLNYRKNGTTFWNALSISPVRDENGALTHFVGVQTDVTPFKRLEEQYRQAQKMEAIGHLAGGIAHDFNNLLTVIMGYAEIALNGVCTDERVAAMLAKILESGQRASSLTRQLLAFSRRQVLQPRPVLLNELVDGIRCMLERVIGEDIELQTLLDPNVGNVIVDPGQLEQVILNLAVNARDAMPKGGKLTVETHTTVLDDAYAATIPDLKSGRYAQLVVSDTGCGMSSEVKSRLFEPFFTTKEAGKGTGLGLATVFGIVKQSGGHIAVYSEVGFGTSFKVFLPETAAAFRAEAFDDSEPVPFGDETVLLVEDEAGVRELTSIALRRAGYTVLEAEGSVQAKEIVSEQLRPIDILLTDVVLKGESGRELAAGLLEDDPGLRVLFMSGYTNDAVVRHGVLHAQVNFIEKPFTVDAIIRKVRDVLDKTEAC